MDWIMEGSAQRLEECEDHMNPAPQIRLQAERGMTGPESGAPGGPCLVETWGPPAGSKRTSSSVVGVSCYPHRSTPTLKIEAGCLAAERSEARRAPVGFSFCATSHESCLCISRCMVNEMDEPLMTVEPPPCRGGVMAAVGFSALSVMRRGQLEGSWRADTCSLPSSPPPHAPRRRGTDTGM
ncbi:unnamed protein product [Gadus morhua 'NCC']